MSTPLIQCKIPTDGLPKLYQGEASKVGDWVRLKGVVLGEAGIVAGEISLKVKDYELKHRFPEAPRIQLAGHALSLRCDNCHLAPPLVREGPWAEIAALPEAAPFQSKAPGPHVKVTLSGWTLHSGQTLEVLGQVSKVGLSSEAEGFRESAQTIITEVEASILIIGDNAGRLLEDTYDATRELQRPPPPPGKPLGERIGEVYQQLAAFAVTHQIMLGVIGWFGLAFVFLVRWGQTDFFFGLAMVTVALYYYYRRAPLPPFFVADNFTTRRFTGDSWAGWVGVLGLALSLLFRFLGSTRQRTKTGGVTQPMEAGDLQIMVLCSFLPVIVFLLVEHLRLTAPAWRVAWLMLRTPKATAGQWGSHLGAPLQSVETLLSHTEHQQKKYDNITDLYLSGDISYRSNAFTLQGDGADKAVDPKGAVWSSTASSLSGWSSNEKLTTRTFQMRALSSQKLLVVGRAEGDALAATGPESLFIFAADEDPRRVLWNRFVFSWVVLLAFVGVLVGGILSMIL